MLSDKHKNSSESSHKLRNIEVMIPIQVLIMTLYPNNYMSSIDSTGTTIQVNIPTSFR